MPKSAPQSERLERRVDVCVTSPIELEPDARKYGIEFELVNECGPGGGWPEYVVRGPRASVERWLADNEYELD